MARDKRRKRLFHTVFRYLAQFLGNRSQLTGRCLAGIRQCMSQPHLDHPGPALLRHEARVRYGRVPAADAPGWSMGIQGDIFQLRTGSGYSLLYHKGQGVTIDRHPDADPAEEELWLNGSTYAAIAAMNGFFPFHASAVAWQGKAYALAGPSGAGKSTLAAALGAHGMPLLCDDTMVLDLAGPGPALCLPGHKRLKLKQDALDLTGATATEKVGAMVDKHYAEPPAGTVNQVLPLAGIVFLETGDTVQFAPVTGAQRIARLNDDHYTAHLYAMARGESMSARLTQLASIAARIPMERFARPMARARFAETVAAVAERIQEMQP